MSTLSTRSIVNVNGYYLKIFQHETDDSQNLTHMERLSMEALQSVKRSKDFRGRMEESVRKFFNEDEIIERTRDCQKYFHTHVPSIATNFNVRNLKGPNLI